MTITYKAQPNDGIGQGYSFIYVRTEQQRPAKTETILLVMNIVYGVWSTLQYQYRDTVLHSRPAGGGTPLPVMITEKRTNQK